MDELEKLGAPQVDEPADERAPLRPVPLEEDDKDPLELNELLPPLLKELWPPLDPRPKSVAGS